MQYTIPLSPISAKDLPGRREGRVDGRVFRTNEDIYEEYRDAAGLYLPPMEIDFPVNIRARFYVRRASKVSLVSLEEALLRVLVDCNVIKGYGSQIVVSMDGSRVWSDEKRPRTEIQIERLN